jgi:hypothetical protein
LLDSGISEIKPYTWEIPAAETLLSEETVDFWTNVRMQHQTQL